MVFIVDAVTVLACWMCPRSNVVKAVLRVIEATGCYKIPNFSHVVRAALHFEEVAP